MIAGRMGADDDDGDGEICRRPATGAYKSAARVMVVRCISWKDPTVRSLRGVLAASVCLLAVPVAFLFQLIVGSGAEIVLHLVGGVGFLLTALAVFDFKPPRWLPWIGCLSIGAFGVTFLLQGISQLLHIDWLTYLAFQILGQQVEGLSADVFLVWCSATVLLLSHGKVKLFGIGAMAVAVSAEISRRGAPRVDYGAGPSDVSVGAFCRPAKFAPYLSRRTPASAHQRMTLIS
jgi:hypothetical protein